MKIAILGTRGIPNYHGGFEQFAEYFSVHMAQKGHEVYVYNSHSHPYQEKKYNGVNILHQKDPEDKLGTFGQFIYDLNCIRDARAREFDVILQLGYTSSSVWGKLLPKESVIVTNMDGLEWKRSKYSKPVQNFLRIAEGLAVKTSDFLIADSIGIQEFIEKKYQMDSEFIAYGADKFENPNSEELKTLDVLPYKYNMLVARLEPENNIETILDGVVLSGEETIFLVVGKHETKFGRYLKNKFEKYQHIRFVGGVYDIDLLNNLRHYSNLYFHGHSVGGTNPSLLEAMASSTLIIAHNNIFNWSILQDDAKYFETPEDIAELLGLEKRNEQEKVNNNLSKIDNVYNWSLINEQYENFILKCLKLEKKR